jgi:hypothetical protein
VGFVQTKNLKKEFNAGFVATALARVIGNEKDPRGVRILFGSEIDRLRQSEPVMAQETKEGQIEYWVCGDLA